MHYNDRRQAITVEQNVISDIMFMYYINICLGLKIN